MSTATRDYNRTMKGGWYKTSRDYLTDEDVELEIERIRSSDAYKLAMAEKQFKYKRRQMMYTMRWYEKHGKELMAEGKTIDDFKCDENDH